MTYAKKKILENLASGSWSILDILGPFESAINKKLTYKNCDVASPLFIRTFNVFSDALILNEQVLIKNRVIVDVPFAVLNFLNKNSISGVFRPGLMQDEGQINDTFQVLKKLYPNDRNLLNYFPNAFFIFEKANFYGASHPHILGAVILGEKFSESGLFDAALSIVHELGHQELFLINTLDRIVKVGSEVNMIYAPFQGVERPPIARMHSLFALYRMVQLERKSGLRRSKNSELMEMNIRSFSKDELTKFGFSILVALQSWYLND